MRILQGRFWAEAEWLGLVVSGRSDHTLTGAVELDTIHG
jgi:hypothetical protein